MKIGIIADTHDNLPQIKRAVDFFNKEKVSYVLHAGDYIAPFALTVLEKLNCPWQGVFGNNDGEKKGLSERSGGKITTAPLEISLGKKNICVVHSLGNTGELPGKKYDAVISGHTHKIEIKKNGTTIFINPGECGGWLYGESSVVIWDTDKLEAKGHKL
ncbi:MAG: metallophosphoesterase [Candidatus Omnitrophota bacterium]